MAWSDIYNLPKAQVKEINRLRKEILKQAPFIQEFDEDGWGCLSTRYWTMDGEWLSLSRKGSFHSAMVTLLVDGLITKTLVWYPSDDFNVYPKKYKIRKE